MVIGIPVYNGEAFVGGAIASALAQDYDNLEVLVVDNASTDQTVSVVLSFQDPRVKLRSFSEFLPVAGNWGRTLSLAEGDFFMFLSADNQLLGGAVRTLVDALADTRYGIAIGRASYVCPDGGNHSLAYPLRPPRPGPLENIEAHVLSHGNNFLTDAVMFRLGLPELRIAGDEGVTADLELLIRLGQAGVQAVAVRNVVSIATVHAESLSSSDPERLWHERLASFAKLREASTRKRAYASRIGRVLAWGAASLISHGRGTAARELAARFIDQASFPWTLLVRAMLAVPATSRAAYALRALLQR